MSVVGARPQFIKAGAVSRAVARDDRVEEVLIHTGQHFDANMSRVFFEELRIPEPKANLGIAGGSHGRMTGRMIEALETVILQENPEAVLVHGDTNSTLAGALAAAKLHVPVAHVEAGLRSFNRRMPEEINRVVTDHVADLLFCPTQTAIDNLQAEGVTRGVVLTGDVMYDSALFYAEMARQRSDVLNRLALKPRSYYLATIHRAENTDDVDRLRGIFDGLSRAPHPVILPVHPRTRQVLAAENIACDAVRAVDPVSYLDMLRLETASRAILTDSGGVQKEAYFAGVPCITLRDETEWVELVDAGWNRLVGSAPDRIARAFAWAEAMDRAASQGGLYGDGHAAERILGVLAHGNGLAEPRP